MDVSDSSPDPLSLLDDQVATSAEEDAEIDVATRGRRKKAPAQHQGGESHPVAKAKAKAKGKAKGDAEANAKAKAKAKTKSKAKDSSDKKKKRARGEYTLPDPAEQRSPRVSSSAASHSEDTHPAAPVALPEDQATSEEESDSRQDDHHSGREAASIHSAPPLSSATGPRPRSSNVSAYMDWAVDQLSPSELARIQEAQRVMSFCTGMATEVIVTTAAVASLRAKNRLLEVRHVASCENAKQKREFLQRRFPMFDFYFNDVAKMSDKYLMDEKTMEVVDRPTCDILTFGFSCKDISGMTPKPKSERGKTGTSAVTLQGALDYLEVLPLEERPEVLLIENAGALLIHNDAVLASSSSAST